MEQTVQRPLALIILDGWGVSRDIAGNAIASAYTPNYDRISENYPSTLLAAGGAAVGANDGDAGNAEIGHMNIGTGRQISSDVSRIREAINSGAFFENDALAAAFSKAAATGQAVHLIGLMSDGGIHSSPDNLFALLRMAKRHNLTRVYIHCILDGRDVPARTADIYVEALEIKAQDIGVGEIATLCGRHFAMDASENWERTVRAFTMLVHGEGERATDPVNAVRASFLRGISDEFIAPVIIEKEKDVPVATVTDGDLVIFFNHRADTMRQLVRSLAMPEPGAMKPSIDVVCLTEYDRSFGLPAAYRPIEYTNTLPQLLAAAGINNCRITETDRFPHVGRYFNGGIEFRHPTQQSVEVDGTVIKDREAEPELRSFKIADAFLSKADQLGGGFYVINLPAAGLLAESGNFERTVEAVQYVDTCLGGIVDKIRELGGVAFITSAYGNCESMTAPNGDADRLPTANPVPFHIVDDNAPLIKLRTGSLRDIAPTILSYLGIEKPEEMTGNDLRN